METIPAKTIVTAMKSGAGWFGARYNMNIYRGCSHGCIYCDSRSECYRNDDFDRVYAKENALSIIRDDLRRKTRTGVVSTGAMSDPYNPCERTEQLTRHALELLAAYGFGAAIATKSDLICRDIDVLREIHENAPVLCKLTVTTVDDALAKKIEPNAPPPSARLDALARLADAGLPTCILLMPTLPWITDGTEAVLSLVRRAKEAHVQFIYPAFGLTLRDRQRAYFYEALDREFPNLREKYVSRFGTRYECASPRARALWSAFSAACDEAGIFCRMRDITRRYQRGYDGGQLTLY
ncbi:MAG: radical SAM protein [Eubacteriales bacterium]|nr:radical SAM protein [Eubacteriales bacterium]